MRRQTRSGLESLRRRGFTLIELLVVIGIIALLAALLTPALWHARRYSQSAACLSNLRQVGIAMQTYTRDHQGWLPAGPADQLIYMNITDGASTELSQDERQSGSWRPVMHTPWQWGGKRASWAYLEDESGTPIAETLLRPLTRQIYPTATLDSPTPVFNCPGDDGLEHWDRPHAGAWQSAGLGRRPIHDLVGNSYFIHLWKGTQSGETQGRRAKKQPGQAVLAYEGILYYNHFTPKNPFVPELPEAARRKSWHAKDNSFNILFLDGHAEHRRLRTANGELLDDQGIIFANYALLMDYYR